MDDEIPYAREPEYLLLLRLLLAQGEYDAAHSLAERLLQMAEAAKRMGRIIEILVLQALIFQGKKDIDQALAILGKAFSLAQPEGYVRIFLDEGEPMAKLLFLVKSQRIESRVCVRTAVCIERSCRERAAPRPAPDRATDLA